MNAEAVLAALDLPAHARVDLRVPKKLLMENGAPTAADRHRIQEGIDELAWLAALKPTTIGVPAYRDELREYLEIAVLRLALRPQAGAARLVELVHRSVPHPLLLLTQEGSRTELSAAHKRKAENEAGRVVLDGDVVAVGYDAGRDDGHWPAFRDRLMLGRLPRESLYALYEGWIGALRALEAARVTGEFRDAAGPEHAAERERALRELVHLDQEIARLRSAATKETQVARQVELNLEIKRMEAARSAARAGL